MPFSGPVTFNSPISMICIEPETFGSLVTDTNQSIYSTSSAVASVILPLIAEPFVIIWAMRLGWKHGEKRGPVFISGERPAEYL